MKRIRTVLISLEKIMYMDNPWVLNCIGPEAGKTRRPVDTAKTVKWKTFWFNEHTPLFQARPQELHDKAVLGHFHKPRWMRPENVEREDEGQNPTRRYPIVSSLDEECLDTNTYVKFFDKRTHMERELFEHRRTIDHRDPIIMPVSWMPKFLALPYTCLCTLAIISVASMPSYHEDVILISQLNYFCISRCLQTAGYVLSGITSVIKER